ncbi:MAG: hypothetical protein JWQ30_2358, partial [Sediminibacterium sp.]|nr:hypothetical protein [Sediminibacterium sp.]
MKNFILPAILFFAVITAHAQDKILRKNGQKLTVKVIEVGSTDIKYKTLDDPDGPVYVLERDRISKIEFANGKVEKFMIDLKDPELYKDQRAKALKINFMAPLIGYSEFSYEKNVGVGKSYELSFGIIGLGKSSQIDWYYNGAQETKKNQFGFFAGGGFKFNKLPDFIFGRQRQTHLMQGGYAKPLVYLGNYSENMRISKNNIMSVEKRNISFGAIEIEFGQQWVMGNALLIDFYWGLGYAFDNKDNGLGAYDIAVHHYSVSRIGTSPGLAVSGG